MGERLFDVDDQDDLFLNLDDELTGGFSTRRDLTPEKRLSSPITTGLVRRIDDYVQQACREANLALTHPLEASKRIHACNDYLRNNPKLNFSSIKKPLQEYCKMLSQCKVKPEIIDPKRYPYLFRQGLYRLPRLNDDYELAREVYRVELDAYMQYLKGVCKPKEIARVRSLLDVPKRLSSKLADLSASAKLWNDIVEVYRRETTRLFRNHKHTIGPVRVVAASGFVILKTDDIPWQLVTYEQLQMIQDATQARLNTYSALHIGFHNGSTRLEHYVDKLLHWQEACLEHYGNDGYELIKAPEALFKTWLNSLTDGDVLEYSSYDRTLDKMILKEKKLSHDPIMSHRLDKLVKQVTNLNDCAELFGLIKLSGHPVVYAEKSAEAVRKEAIPVGTQNIYYIRQVRRMMVHVTLSGYINKHGSWPPMRCLPPRGTELRRHYNNRTTSLPLSAYNLSDNDGVVFDKFVEFDYSDDYLKFLDDKAICPGVDECSKFWYGNADQRERRLLTKILDLPHFDCRANVERIRRRQFRPDEMVVELTQKERELKNSARCFCKLPISVRTFFTLTEYNLGEYFMKPYMPQQTMTMSNTENRSRLYHMTRNSKHRKTVLVESDFSRWNLCMRESTVSAVTDVLEQIFGLPGVFSQAHWFFSHATIVLTDKHSLPEGADPTKPVSQWPESSLVWRNHRGGFEGIIQKIWTVFTICMVMLVLYDKNVSFIMAGQGDNQVFALQFDDSEESLRSQLVRVLADMRVRCRFLNHDVKPEECIDSLTVLTYSKEIYVEGVHLLYNLKFASRTMPTSDSDVPSLSKEIAAINATAIACADSCKYGFKGVFWRSWHTLQHFTMRRTSPVYENEWPTLNRIRDSPDVAKFVLQLPGSLGGLPVQSWGRFFLKGEVDDLSWDVSAIKRLAVADRALANDLHLLEQGEYTVKQPDLTQLILDPTSIPIRRPKDQSRLIKELVQGKLPGITRNKWIGSIIGQDTSAKGDVLLNRLAQSSPLYPKIMSDIYSCSLSGVRDTLIGRFTMTRTIVNVTGSSNFTREILAGNIRLLQNLEQRFRNAVRVRNHHKFTESAFEICERLRALWGNTVKHPNIGVYCPLDWELTTDLSSVPTISASTRTPVPELLTDVGPYPPNFGTQTRQKVSQHGYKIVMSSGTLQDIKRLVITASELKAEGNFAVIIDDIIRSRSPFCLETLSTVFPVCYGGTAAHRHDQLNSSAFSILGSKTVPTHLNFCSDSAGILSGGELDYPVVFQEAYLFLTQIYLCLSSTHAVSTPRSIGLVVPDALAAIDDDQVKLDPLLDCQIDWPHLPTNRLCYEDTITLNEIPLEPPKSLIPHYTASEIRPTTAIFNLLLSSTPTRDLQAVTRSSIILPVELVDLKEFNHTEVSSIITAAAWYSLTVALYLTIRTNPRDAHVFLYESLWRTSNYVGSRLARLFLHRSNAFSKFCVSTNIMLEPGKAGALNSGSNLAGYIVQRSYSALSAHELLYSKDYKCLLFKDTAAKYNSLALMCSIAIVACSTFDHKKLLVTSYQRKVIEISYLQAESVIPNVSGPRIIEMGCQEALNSAKHSERISGSFHRWLGYMYTTAPELVRTLRAGPRTERVRVDAIIRPLSCRRTPLSGKVTWKNTRVYTGHVALVHTCEYNRSAIGHFADRLLRPYGRFSSAMSTWHRYFATIHQRLAHATVLSVGVGHGAVAATSLELGAHEVQGIDLVDSFPLITQREGTYVPHEVINSGHGDKFKWHTHTYEHGGDVHLLDWTTVLHYDVIIIDVEISFKSLSDVLSALPLNREIIVRFSCCDMCLKWLLANYEVTHLYCQSALQSDTMAYIGKITRQFETLTGSVNDIVDLTRRAVGPAIDRRLPYATERINDIVLTYGLETGEATLPELRMLAGKIRKMSHFLSDVVQYQRASDTADDLELIERLVHEPTIMTEALVNSWSRMTRSRVAAYLSCTLPNIGELIDSWRI